MRKNVFGRKFKRDKNERKAFFKGLISALVLNERIVTTEPRAKAIKGDADKIITKVKRNKELAQRTLGDLLNKEALNKLIKDLAPRFVNRNGGYTRIVRIGKRFGDDAMQVVLEWTEQPRAVAITPGAAKSPKAKVTVKKTKAITKPKRAVTTKRPVKSAKKK